jgi:hypothetical protein
MMQVWLVLLGAVLLWQGDNWARASTRHSDFAGNATLVLFLLGWGCILLSVVTFFINGGTTG